MSEFLKHAAAAVVAASVGGGGAYYAVKSTTLPQVTFQQRQGDAFKRMSPAAWGNLEQREIDALTAELRKLPAKSEVAIFCQHGCDDMAIDFENALESAKWSCGIERPLYDTNRGINVAPDSEQGRALRDAIEKATGGRLKVGMVEGEIDQPGRLAIIISRKAAK